MVSIWHTAHLALAACGAGGVPGMVGRAVFPAVSPPCRPDRAFLSAFTGRRLDGTLVLVASSCATVMLTGIPGPVGSWPDPARSEGTVVVRLWSRPQAGKHVVAYPFDRAVAATVIPCWGTAAWVRILPSTATSDGDSGWRRVAPERRAR